MLKRETKLIQLEKVQFFIVLKADRLTGKEMKEFTFFLEKIIVGALPTYSVENLCMTSPPVLS